MTNNRCQHCGVGRIQLKRHEFVIGISDGTEPPTTKELRQNQCDVCGYSIYEIHPLSYAEFTDKMKNVWERVRLDEDKAKQALANSKSSDRRGKRS